MGIEKNDFDRNLRIFTNGAVVIAAVIVVLVEAPKGHWTIVIWAGLAAAGYLRLLANDL